MKTEIKLEQKIINITTLIHKEFPELAKYIQEMPANNSEKDGVTIKTLKEYLHSLEEILVKYGKTHVSGINAKNIKSTDLEGYPRYPPSEDIYRQFKEEKNLNPEDPSKKKSPIMKEKGPNEKGFEDDMSGDDLDVPGSELDNQQESVGSEDEENNYYSLGGDAHEDLEEDNA